MPETERQAAYEALLRRYLGPLRRLAYAHTYHAHERDDLLQDIALALWKALPAFRGEASERTWVYRIAHNTAIRFITMRARRGRHEQYGDDGIEIPAVGDSPERTVLDRQRREQLWSLVRCLPWHDRRLIVLHLEGLSAAEVASITGLSPGNVATRLTRLRQRLMASIRQGDTR